MARDGSYALGGWGQAHIASSLSAMLLSGTDDKVRYIGGSSWETRPLSLSCFEV